MEKSHTKLAIVVVAFSRPTALQRLLDSINSAKYPAGDIHLLISIDGGGHPDMKTVAEAFNFHHGKAKIIVHGKNMGLRQHVLSCGDQAMSRDGIIMLEEDLVVHPNYYFYAQVAQKWSEKNALVAGISLYSPSLNEYVNVPFSPLIEEDSDAYMMQIPCSWGQSWSKRQWGEFRKWMENEYDERFHEEHKLPQQVQNWSQKSWKKIFNLYLVRKGKYILYPYRSYSTNCADTGGVHMINTASTHQVEMWLSRCSYPDQGSQLLLEAINVAHVRYDAFMEPEAELLTNTWLSSRAGAIDVVDVFGTKPTEGMANGTVITSRKVIDPVLIIRCGFKPLIWTALTGQEAEGGVNLYVGTAAGIVEESRFQRIFRLRRMRTHLSNFDTRALEFLIPAIYNEITRRIVQLIPRRWFANISNRTTVTTRAISSQKAKL